MELGIKGHETRGDEIIKILEMLGGKNRYEMRGSIYNNYFYYIDDEYKDISYSYIGPDEINGYKIFSLDEFLEKYPYKVGDKVTLDNKLCSIIWMCWECNNIYYQVQGTDLMFTKKVIANELKPYKEKNTNMNIEYDLAKYSYEIKDGKLVIGEKKQVYPTTYKECCELLGCKSIIGFAGLDDEEENLYGKFIALKRCRDAYWKIAGEQMGLGKPWEPDFTNDDEERYGIYTTANKVEKDFCGVGDVNTILTFPTEEMRDAFYNNFKFLIEQCKELL